MVKKGLKIFGMGIGTLAILAGIIVGILFATGVLGKKASSGGSGSPNNNGSIVDPGSISIFNVKNMGGDCIPPGPCQASSGIGYNFESTCSNKTGNLSGCSTVIDFNLTYSDGTTATSTKTFDGTASGGGASELFFRNVLTPGSMGQTRVPSSVSLSGYSVYKGMKGDQSAPVIINL